MITKKQTIRILERARKLLCAGWTQHVFARNAGGHEVASYSPVAVCFCISGALTRAGAQSATGGYEAARRALQSVSPLARKQGIVSYNDAPRRKKVMVLRLFTRAIAKLKGVRP